MPDRLIDLDQPDVRLPVALAVDSNLLVARLLTTHYPPHLQAARRVNRFFALLRTQHAVGVIPTTAGHEFFHLALRGAYQLAVPNHRAALAASAATAKRRFNWEDLYKLRPDLIDSFLPELRRYLSLFRFNNLKVIQPDELVPLPPSQRYEEELLRLVGRYRLNSNDAAILMEAQRAGIASIATLDGDMRRAAVDFAVYTWL